MAKLEEITSSVKGITAMSLSQSLLFNGTEIMCLKLHTRTAMDSQVIKCCSGMRESI